MFHNSDDAVWSSLERGWALTGYSYRDVETLLTNYFSIDEYGAWNSIPASFVLSAPPAEGAP
jgi:hypothetical protein